MSDKHSESPAGFGVVWPTKQGCGGGLKTRLGKSAVFVYCRETPSLCEVERRRRRAPISNCSDLIGIRCLRKNSSASSGSCASTSRCCRYYSVTARTERNELCCSSAGAYLGRLHGIGLRRVTAHASSHSLTTVQRGKRAGGSVGISPSSAGVCCEAVT